MSTAQPKPREDEIDVFGVTHAGLKRGSNQDHFLISSLGARLVVHQTSLPDPPDESLIPELGAGERAAFLAVVADGVGSSSWGEEASRLAVEEVTLYVARSMHAFYTTDPNDDGALLHALDQAAQRSHAELLRRAEEDAARRGMATTLTLWLGVWPRAFVLQVGDSRYYSLRDGELTQVSRDQTIAQDLVDQGVLSQVDASRTRWAHVLSSAIGGPSAVPTITRVQNDWSTVHLLCSDGLTKHVSDERIRERLAGMESAQQACEALLGDALEGGGTDNITIIVGRAKPSV
ncbi:protein phosphatase 2C domain-containing protein [soil metagenome]